MVEPYVVPTNELQTTAFSIAERKPIRAMQRTPHRVALLRSVALLRPALATLALGACLAAWTESASVQAQEFQLPPGVQVSPEQMERMRDAMERRRNRRGNSPPQSEPEAQPAAEKPATEEAKGEEEKKPEEGQPSTVKRSAKPQFEPDANELKAEPKNGKIEFSFHGQPWESVLQWYADISGVSFDWQELPEDYVNLTTTRPYSLQETRDALNRQLLARGFTLLKQGDVMSAVAVAKLDPSLLPTVDADELEDFSPFDFVKTRFALPTTLEPEKAAEDVKILLSPHAKVTPLLATRRLLVIDAVANLREVRDLLYAEQSAVHEDTRPHVYMIQHRRADYVADQVMIVLGLDPASRKNPMELQLEQQRLQLYTQLTQKGKDVSAMLRKDGPPVHVTVDKVRNAVLINAPPELIPTIERTIKNLDVPNDGGEVADPSRLEMRPYKTSTRNTDGLVSAIKEIGDLHPLTQLQSDADNRTIFAYATPADHAKIEATLQKLDQSKRDLRVIWLNRRSSAERVAGTIASLMSGEEEDQQSGRRSRYMMFPWGRQSNEDEGKFKVEADIENNRLLMLASEDEFERVKGLLDKLGIMSSENAGDSSRVRVLDARSPEETARLLEQLQRTWGGKNRLRIQRPQRSRNAAPESDKLPDDEAGDDESEGLLDRTTHWQQSPYRLVATTRGDGGEEDESDDQVPEDSSEDPPVNVTVLPDGRILINSEDAAALDQLEDLVDDLSPAVDEFHVIHLKNSRAYDVYYNLKEYFKDELAGQTETVFNEWGEYSGRREKNTGPSSMSRRPLLKFIWDESASNSIVVQNASPSQLATIRKLIEVYDQPVGEDSVARRRTAAVKIKYSRAEDIAASIKEVYRDLLSSKDKEFQGKDGKSGSARTETYYRIYGAGDSGDNSKKTAPMKVGFEGALSVGVDEISNSLIISAEENVWATVKELVVQLDEAARPDTAVRVRQVRSGVATSRLKQALAEALSQPWPGGKPPGQAAAKSGGNKGGDDANNANNNGQQRQRERN
ncbi:MAG: hypothetical protein KDA61_04825 [Planctomycetales bacterium]|nr:hypothetical protein [Planctomycetales bacterium]